MELMTPAGRLVQGGVVPQHQKNMQNQLKFNADGSPEMGTLIVLAFPKTGPGVAEYNAFHAQLTAAAMAAWPQFFVNGVCTNPKFSWKIQDGDGVDSNGVSVADKPGFRGNWIVKFYTSYPVGCYHKGKWLPHEVMQKPEDYVKRGHWVRLAVEVRSNNADLSLQQVPGIALYPKMLEHIQVDEEIVGGPDAAATFGAAPLGYVPAPTVAAPVTAAAGGVALPPPPVVAAPVAIPPPPVVAAPVAIPLPPPVTQQEQYTPTATMPAGVTVAGLIGNGWTHEAIVAQGYAVKNY